MGEISLQDAIKQFLNHPRRDAILQGMDIQKQHDAWIKNQLAVVASDLQLDTPFRNQIAGRSNITGFADQRECSWLFEENM